MDAKILLFVALASIAAGLPMDKDLGPTTKDVLNQEEAVIRPEDLPPLVPLVASQRVCRPALVDVMFALDESGSIGSSNFQSVKQFVANIASASQLTGANRTQVGVVLFDGAGHLEWNLDTYSNDPSHLLNAINALPYSGGGTNIASGMQMAIAQFNASAGARAGVAKVLIVLTDGQDSSNVAAQLAAAQAENIHVLAIGVGSGVNYAELLQVAGDARNVFNISSFSNLTAIAGTVCHNIGTPCDSSPCVNGGSCSNVNGSTSFMCVCPLGFGGDQCQNPIGPQPCSGHGSYVCTCDYGYTGPHCDQEIDWCNVTANVGASNSSLGDLCSQHGRCVSSPAGIQCICDFGFEGVFCDKPIPGVASTSYRCALWQNSVTIHENVTYTCPSDQRCLTDDLDCPFQPDLCPNPIGWCVPKKMAATIIENYRETFAKKNGKAVA